jgi:ribokinase
VIVPPRVLVVGSANVDFTVSVARLPQPGETVTNGTLLVNHGGKGANQAVAARRLGAEVRFDGCVGDDASGRAIRDALAAEGIGVDGLVATSAAATGTALIIVDATGANQIAVAPGANRALTPEHVAARGEDSAWAGVVMCQRETRLETTRAVLERARRERAITVLNPAPVPDAELDFLGLVDYLTPNAGEAGRLGGGPGTDDLGEARRAGDALRRRGAGTVLVTLGARGVVACSEIEASHVPAYSVSAVDTTAAGDAFNGALAVGLAESRGLLETLRFANAAAALACTRRGAQASLPTRAEIEARGWL